MRKAVCVCVCVCAVQQFLGAVSSPFIAMYAVSVRDPREISELALPCYAELLCCLYCCSDSAGSGLRAAAAPAAVLAERLRRR